MHITARVKFTSGFFTFICFTAVALLSSYTTSAQTLQDSVWKHIKEKRYAIADTIVSSALQRDPNNVDALMMRGNIMLSAYLDSADTASFYIQFNESVFDSTMDSAEVPVRIIPVRLALAIDSVWKKCLLINKRRIDIQQGICYVYSLALMKNELLAYLPKLKEIVGEEPGLMYTMGDYAQMFGERGRFEDAIEIYRNIEAWYPGSAGLLSDIGVMYYQKGRMKEAKLYFNRAMEMTSDDEIVFSNARLFYSAEGSYDRALKAAIMLAGIDKSHEGLLYRGIYEYYMNDNNWRASLESFVRLNEGQRDRNSLKLARALLAKTNHNDYSSYLQIDTLEVNEVYKLMLHKRAMNLFVQEYVPILNFGRLSALYSGCPESVKAFALADTRGIVIPAALAEDHIFYSAWALQQSGMKIEAAIQWKKLLFSGNFFKKSAAAYFYGRYMQGVGYQKDAIATYNLVSKESRRSKYAAYCARLQQTLEKKP